MESREIEWKNVMEWDRVGTFMKVFCSLVAFVCAYVCARLYEHVYGEKGYVESCSLRFNP